MHVDVQGPPTFAGDYVVSDPGTLCSDLTATAGNDVGFSLPDSSDGEAAGGHTVVVSIDIPHEHFRGPGTYSLADLDRETAYVEIDTQTEAQPNAGGASASLVLAADASGKLSFAGWDDTKGHLFSGEVHWTCKDQP